MSGLMRIYVIARSVDWYLLMARGPFIDSDSFADQFIALFLQGLAHLLPSLSLFARAEWLIEPLSAAGAQPLRNGAGRCHTRGRQNNHELAAVIAPQRSTGADPVGGGPFD